jgi:hypothetical protein
LRVKFKIAMHGSLAKILDSGNASEKRSATVFTSLQAASTTEMLSRERRSFIRCSGSPGARISAKPLAGGTSLAAATVSAAITSK